MNATNDTETAEQLRERLRRLEMATEAAGLGVWEWDPRSGALIWNDRNRELLGAPPTGEVTIQDYLSFVHPDDRDLVRAAYRSAADLPDGGDYRLEHRTSKPFGGRPRWLLSRGRVIKDAEGVASVVGSTFDVTELKASEERRSLVLRELAHRAKNGILVMMAIVNQTARSAESVQDFEAVLTARLKAMADSQDLVTEAAGRALPLSDLLGQALTPFDPGRFDVDPKLAEINIPNDAVVALALLLHELSTNAVKYGALSAPGGRVSLNLAKVVDGRTVLAWAEAGGPPVKPVTRKGFGTRLIEISLRANGGAVEGVFDPQGFRASITLPLAGL